MALLGPTNCVICNKQIEDNQSAVSTAGSAFPKSHELWKFCDTWMHSRCLETWKYRFEFSEAFYNQFYKRYIDEEEFVLAKGDDWFLGMSPPGKYYTPEGEEDTVFLHLREWPSTIPGHAFDWTCEIGDSLHLEAANLPKSVEVEVLSILEEVTRIFPTTRAIRSAINKRMYGFSSYLEFWEENFKTRLDEDDQELIMIFKIIQGINDIARIEIPHPLQTQRNVFSGDVSKFEVSVYFFFLVKLWIDQQKRRSTNSKDISVLDNLNTVIQKPITNQFENAFHPMEVKSVIVGRLKEYENCGYYRTGNPADLQKHHQDLSNLILFSNNFYPEREYSFKDALMVLSSDMSGISCKMVIDQWVISVVPRLLNAVKLYCEKFGLI